MSKNVSLKDFFNDININKLYTLETLDNTLLPQRLIKSLLEIKPDEILIINDKPIILFFNRINVLEYGQDIIFRKCWNFAEAPIVIIESETDFEIYNGFEFIIETKELEQLSKDNLSYISILNGDYFKEIKTNKKNKQIDKVLLQNIKDARDLLLKNGLSKYKNIANSLIGRIIFVRYLIDRNVYLEKYKKILTNNDLKEFLNSKQETYQLFEYLKSDEGFNGDWFPIEENEQTIVNENHLEILNELISGTQMSTGQRSLFDIYDFSIIPIEFISNVYESFIGENEQRETGAYYTPTFLVDYILKYTVDDFFINNPNTYNCKVLDPACGSGIFLVETLRKLVTQFEKIKKRSIKEAELKKLVQDNIFGIDKDKDAISISVFSLYLAMLDYQNPKELAKFRFPNLLISKKNKHPNFFNDDFFNIEGGYNQILKTKRINCIIGNPPYGESTIKTDDSCFKYVHANNITIGNKDIVQAFMIRVKDFISSKTKISFIVTSTLLYNKSTEIFRKENFFNTFKVNHILELSSVRKEVFENADVPVSIIFYEYSKKEQIEENIIKYISMKPTPYFQKLKTLILSKQDFKKIKQSELLINDYLWKILIYGNYLDFNFIKKLKTNKIPTIQSLIEQNKLIKYQGFKRKDGKKRIDSKDLKGYNFINTHSTKKDLKPFYISQKLDKFDYDFVGYLNKNLTEDFTDLYKAPILLFTGGLSNNLKQNSAITYKNATFTSSIVALKSLSNDIETLKTINGLFYSTYFSYYLLHTASSTGVRQEECNDYEKLKIHFIENKSIPLIVTKIENLKKDFYDSCQIQNSYEYENKLNKLIKELDTTILKALNLNEQEYSLVDYTNTIIIPWVIQKKYTIAFNKLKFQDNFLNEYIHIFINHYTRIYTQNNMYFQANILWDDYAIGIYFKVLDTKPAKNIVWHKEKNIQNFLKISGKHTLEHLFLQKEIKGFEEDGFYVIKPNEYKNWHKAIGYLDFYEFKDAILRAGKKGN